MLKKNCPEGAELEMTKMDKSKLSPAVRDRMNGKNKKYMPVQQNFQMK